MLCPQWSLTSSRRLDIIDHRSWHPRGINTTLVNEIYAKDKINVGAKGTGQKVLEERMAEITAALEKAIAQPDTSSVKISRWYPGVVEEIVESVHEKSRKTGKKKLNIEERLLSEAASELDRKQTKQLQATQEKTVDEILAGMASAAPLQPLDEGVAIPGASTTQRARRRRQKMRSTPVVGGGLFGETSSNHEEEDDTPKLDLNASKNQNGEESKKKKWKPNFDFGARGHKAEIVVDGESYDIRINDETLKALRTGYSGDMLDSRGMSMGSGIVPDSGRVVNQLHGYIRNPNMLSKITEETDDGESSDTSSHFGVKKHDDLDQPPV